MIFRTSAFLCAVTLLTLPALAATPPKAAKPTAAKSAGAKSAAKPAAAKASSKPAPTVQPAYRLPAGGKPVPVPPPPTDLTNTTAQKPAARAKAPADQKQVAQAKAPVKPKAKKVAKTAPKKKAAPKKKQVAGAKDKVKQGRAALSPMERIDKRQLATDHLSGAESKSTLELLVSYKETLREGDLETAGVLLRLIANETPSREVATVVNDLIGIPLNTQDTEVLIEISRADRASAVAGHNATKGVDEKVPSPLGERIHAAHAAIEAAPRTPRIEALAAYKHAVTEGNAKAAAVALSGVVQGPLDEATVNTANALLGVENIMPGRQVSAN